MTTSRKQPLFQKVLVNSLKLLLPCLVLAAGVITTQSLLEGKPPRRSQPGKPPARMVDIQYAKFSNETPIIIAQGEVQAKRSVQLRSQLRGAIVDLPSHLIPGSFVEKGESLVTLDDRDYLLAVKEAEASLARQQALYDVEIGRRRAAEMEYQLSGQKLSDEDLALVLRQPQLAQIEADIARSQASLEGARINYERTRIRAPFDAQILHLEAAEGSLVRDNTTLMDLVATDTFWLTVSIPSYQLQWLSIPPAKHQNDNKESGCIGSHVIIRNPNEWGEDSFRDGCVTSLLPELDKRVKTASILIEIDDPLAQRPENKGKPVVLLNAFLQAEIETNPFKSVVNLPRRYLQKDQFVWVMNARQQLEAREVSIAYRGQNNVLIASGINPSDRIITTPMMGAVEGIDLKVRSVHGDVQIAESIEHQRINSSPVVEEES